MGQNQFSRFFTKTIAAAATSAAPLITKRTGEMSPVGGVTSPAVVAGTGSVAGAAVVSCAGASVVTTGGSVTTGVLPPSRVQLQKVPV